MSVACLSLRKAGNADSRKRENGEAGREIGYGPHRQSMDHPPGWTSSESSSSRNVRLAI